MSPQIREIDRQIKEASRVAEWTRSADKKQHAIQQGEILKARRRAQRTKEVAELFPKND